MNAVAPYGERPYEWVEGVATFVVDPGNDANARIVDLGLAPGTGTGR